jgi:hypothetical protein
LFDKTRINLQPITLNCDTILSSAISAKDLIIAGKYQYRPSFIDKNLKFIRLYFRVKYNDTNSAVMKDRMEFSTFLKNSGFAIDDKIDIDQLLYYKNSVFEKFNDDQSIQYFIHFSKNVGGETYEGYIIFIEPTDRDSRRNNFNKYELKLIKYIKSKL